MFGFGGYGLDLDLLGPAASKWVKKQREEAKAQREAMPAVAWSETLKWEPLLKIDGATWQPPRLFDVEPHGPGCDLPCIDSAQGAGDWSYHHLLLPAGEMVTCVLGNRRGRVFFTTDVIVPTIYQHQKLWMSYTPQEWFTLRPGVRVATGRVLVGGLGMGVQLRAIARKKSVREILVAEQSPELVNFFGQRLVDDIARESGKPVRVEIGNAFEVAERLLGAGPGCVDDACGVDSVLFDIWERYGTARNDYKWQKLCYRAARAGVKTWAWGAAGAPGGA